MGGPSELKGEELACLFLLILTSYNFAGWQMDHTDKEKPSTMRPTLGKFGTQLNTPKEGGVQ